MFVELLVLVIWFGLLCVLGLRVSFSVAGFAYISVDLLFSCFIDLIC